MTNSIIHNYTYGCAGIGDFLLASYQWYCYCDVNNIRYSVNFDCKNDVVKVDQKLFMVEGKYMQTPLANCFDLKSGYFDRYFKNYKYHVNISNNDGSKFVNQLNYYMKSNKSFNYILFTNVHGSDISEKVDLRRDFLNFLKKNEILNERINTLSKQIINFDNAIHLRLGDHGTFKKRPGTDKRISIENAKIILDKHPHYFLFTDSEELKKEYRARTLDIIPTHVSFHLDTNSKVIDTVAEFFILGKFTNIYYAHGAMSSFSRAAAFLHGRKYICINPEIARL